MRCIIELGYPHDGGFSLSAKAQLPRHPYLAGLFVAAAATVRLDFNWEDEARRAAVSCLTDALTTSPT